MDRVTLKFLNAAHVDSILINGTLMFSSFSHFRKKEGDRWISDPDEAASRQFLLHFENIPTSRHNRKCESCCSQDKRWDWKG